MYINKAIIYGNLTRDPEMKAFAQEEIEQGEAQIEAVKLSFLSY